MKITRKTGPILAALVLLIAGGLCAAFAFSLFPPIQPGKNAMSVDSSGSNGAMANVEKPEAPNRLVNENGTVDFAAEAEKYPDVYAWIVIPGTDIDLPVVQHPTNDFYYLEHNPSGYEDANGSIYTQMCNSKDFQDPVTVVYGHDMNLSGAMFSQLHLFEDKGFFNEHEYFEIYLPNKILRYRIISAYASDDRHIMNSFDFSNETIRQQYFDSVCHPSSMVANWRDDARLGTDDKIVQLSTCMSNAAMPNSRYLVTGELVETQVIG